MSTEVMKRIKSLLQDTKMIDSHTISAVVAECDMAILAKQPATGEPVAALVRSRRIRTPADCAFDKKDHYSEWSDWEPCTLSYARAVTDPARDKGLLPLYEMLPLYTHPAPSEPATGEPVGFTYQAEIDYANSTGGNGSFWRVPPDLDDEAVPLYTCPAPRVPDDDFDLICNAIDKADTITMEGDYMLDSDDCIAVVRVMQALLSVRAAMLAAK